MNDEHLESAQGRDRLDDVTDGAFDKLNEAEAEIEAKLQAFDKRAQEAKQKATERTKKEKAKQPEYADAETARGMGVGMQIAGAIVGLPVVGWLVGYLIDGRQFGGQGAAISTTIASTAAIGYAIWVLQRSNKDDKPSGA